MRIGIDAKWFFKGPASGKIVIQNLIEKIIATDFENEFFLFLDKKEKTTHFPYSREKVYLEYIWAENNMLSNLFAIPQRAQKLNLDVVIFQTFPSYFGNFKKVAYIHDVLFLSHPQYYTFLERLYFTPLRALSKKSDLVITVSEEEKNRLLKYSYHPENGEIKVVYHGVASIFKPKEAWDAQILRDVQLKFRLPQEFILFVGRLNIRKNLLNLIRAIALLNNTSIPLVVVGDEDWKTIEFMSVIKDLKIENRIILTGGIYGSELAAVYSLAKIFCFPSLAESFGLPALEAMASGVPIVVSNSTSLPEICGRAALYVDPTKPQEIANAVDNYLDNENLYTTHRLLGLERARCFNWNKSTEQLLKYTVQII